MKENIRQRTFNKHFTVTLKSRNGEKRTGESYATIEAAETILQEYHAQGLNMTLRQLYYQMVARDLIPNDDAMYKKLSALLTDARYAGLLDWNMMDDLTRKSTRHSQWPSIADLLDSALYSYRKPRWQGQPYHVELLTEKEALHSVLQPIADDWHIFLSVNRGFNSATLLYKLAERVKYEIGHGKDVVFLYIGDHDPSGLAMIDDLKSRITELLEHWNIDADKFRFTPIALTMAQIREYNPPKNPAKEKDSRFKAYQQQFGDVSWEVDALRPNVLKGIVERHIVQYVDKSMFDAVCQQEAEEAKKLRMFVATWKD